MSVGVAPPKAAQWRRRMERFRASGSSIAAFCREEGVSQPSFYQWRKRLTVQDEEDRRERLGFAAVRVVGTACVSATLPGGTRVEIPATDERTLRAALETLARIDAERAGESSC